MSLPYKYKEWYKQKWQTDPLIFQPTNSLVIPCLRGMQGTKSAGHVWYILISGVLKKLGLIRSSSDHDIYTWNYIGDNTICPVNSCSYKEIFCVTKDDLLLLTNNRITLQHLCLCFDSIFKYTFQENSITRFLNFRIIQSSHGISIDQTEHTIKNVINDYWDNKNTAQLPWISSPFPMSKDFELNLFNAIPLLEDDHKKIIQ